MKPISYFFFFLAAIETASSTQNYNLTIMAIVEGKIKAENNNVELKAMIYELHVGFVTG